MSPIMGISQILLLDLIVLVFNTTFSNISAISWREQVYFQRDDDEVRFVLDQHTELDFL